jgi:hypothetical protein
MTVYHGKNGAVKVGSDAAGEVTDFSLTITADVTETTAMGDDWKTRVATYKDWNAEIVCMLDQDDAAQIALAVGASVTLGLYPEGSGAGGEYFSGSAIVTSEAIRVPMGDVVKCTFSCAGNGTLSRSTVSA